MLPPSTGAGTTPGDQVSKSDIEKKLQEITGEVGGEVESARNLAITAGVAVVTVVIVVAFLLGRRRGRKRTTVVEIRRL